MWQRDLLFRRKKASSSNLFFRCSLWQTVSRYLYLNTGFAFMEFLNPALHILYKKNMPKIFLRPLYRSHFWLKSTIKLFCCNWAIGRPLIELIVLLWLNLGSGQGFGVKEKNYCQESRSIFNLLEKLLEDPASYTHLARPRLVGHHRMSSSSGTASSRACASHQICRLTLLNITLGQ